MIEFAVWAPEVDRVRLRLRGSDREMTRNDGGWWRMATVQAGPGTDYAFLFDDREQPQPDPRSLWQPAGVDGPSRVYDHSAFAWTDAGWAGRRLPGGVLYELHVGTFTPEGTFDAAIDRLDHLVDLGVDLVELLSVNAFTAAPDWGDEEVSWFAPHEPYGGPDGLKRFVDACHRHGLGVVIDVVYNDGRPERLVGPGRPVGRDRRDWEAVRRYIIDSALMWLRDYHADGLRLDAVPALGGPRAADLLDELADEVQALSIRLGRPLSLIAESDHADPRLVTASAAGTGTGTAGGCPRAGSPQSLADVLTAAFFHTDRWSTPRPATLSPTRLAVGATLLLTGPYTPMIFMGEEWAALNSTLDWSEPELGEHRQLLALYQRLVALRKHRPELADPRPERVEVRRGHQFMIILRGRSAVVANLADRVRRISLPEVPRTVLLATRTGVVLTRTMVEMPGETAAVVAFG